MANSHDSCAIADEEKRVINSAGEHPTEQTHCPKLSPQDRTSMWSMRSDDSIRAAHDARSEITACSRDAANTTDTDTDGEGVPPPPDGGYGWVCVFSCFLINAFSWGVVCSYGVYLAYYLSHSLFPTATPTDYALLGGLNFGTATLCAPFITILTRHFGPRPLIIFGALLQSAALVLASLATRTWHLHLTQGFLLGLGVGFTYIPSVAILPQWFAARRSVAAGIAAAGSGVGGLLFSFATQPLIDRFSLAWALRITALVSGSMLLVAALLLRTRNAEIQPRQHGFAVSLLARYEVVLLLAWAFASVVGYSVLLFSMSAFARGIGIGARRAADVTGLVNVGTAVGRPLVGVLSDRLGRIEVAGVVTAVCGLSVFAVWVPATGEALLMVFAIVAGATLGTFWVAIGPLCVEVVGLVELPALLSLAWIVIVVPCTISEVIALKLRRPETAQPYLGPQVLAGTAYLVAAGIMLELWRVHRLKTRRGGSNGDSSVESAVEKDEGEKSGKRSQEGQGWMGREEDK